MGLVMLSCCVRWMILRDLPAEEMKTRLRQRNQVGLVAEHGDDIAGHLIYSIHRRHLKILRIAVKPSLRRHGVATQLVDKLKGKLTIRKAIYADVSDRNLGAQLFFRDVGFHARCVDADVYEFRYPPKKTIKGCADCAEGER